MERLKALRAKRYAVRWVNANECFCALCRHSSSNLTHDDADDDDGDEQRIPEKFGFDKTVSAAAAHITLPVSSVEKQKTPNL